MSVCLEKCNIGASAYLDELARDMLNHLHIRLVLDGLRCKELNSIVAIRDNVPEAWTGKKNPASYSEAPAR